MYLIVLLVSYMISLKVYQALRSYSDWGHSHWCGSATSKTCYLRTLNAFLQEISKIADIDVTTDASIMHNEPHC